jgi:hypothetical protein
LQVIWEDEAVKPYEQDKTGSTLPSPQKKHDDHKE